MYAEIDVSESVPLDSICYNPSFLAVVVASYSQTRTADFYGHLQNDCFETLLLPSLTTIPTLTFSVPCNIISKSSCIYLEAS